MAKTWLEPMRIIQTNLQVTDTTGFNAKRLVDQIMELGANALVFNVGGIYAWYPTQIPYHTVNPFMEPGRDLVGEVVEACRHKGVLFFARYDFSKASDYVYRQHPEWFVRLEGNRPQMVAQDRLGKWDQLVSTCLHGGYQNEDVAFPVLRESMERYHPDGIFITSMVYAPCQCENCCRIYRERYNVEIPTDPTKYVPGFAEAMMDESVKRYDAIVKSIDPGAAFLHRAMLDDGRTDQADAFRSTKWWFPKTGEYEVFFDHPIDLVHGETHDGLTGGRARLSPRYTPSVTMKLANSLPLKTAPVDIVHSAPGVGWRHTGLPAAEHRFWLSQVPANRGQIWHSRTGIPDHIPDKEQLQSVRWVNERVKKVEQWMHTSSSAADVALIWNNVAGHGWAAGLTAARIPFDVLLQKQIAKQKIPSRYKWVICPEKDCYMTSTVDALMQYVESGGKVVLEGKLPDVRLKALAGLTQEQQQSEWLSTSYLKIETESLRKGGLEPLVPFSGYALYSRYDSQTDFPVTLVPPFAPAEGAGSPPERAVLPQVDVAWPMIARKDRVVHCAFSFHDLLERYGLRSHIQLLGAILEGERIVRITETSGLQVSVFEVEGGYLVHLVNGVGERPLQTVIPIHDVVLQMALPQGKTITGARWIFEDKALPVCGKGNQGTIYLPPITSWEAVYISTKKE